MKVNREINNIFVGIIKDVPAPIVKLPKDALVPYNKNGTVLYDQFYNDLYRIVLAYVPRGNENPIKKAIIMLPRAISNAKRVKDNSEIISKQNEILDKYFYLSGNENIKEKLEELKGVLDELMDSGDIEILETVLSRFDDRIRRGLLVDLDTLSKMLEERR